MRERYGEREIEREKERNNISTYYRDRQRQIDVQEGTSAKQ